MELSKELIESQGFSEDQVKAINKFGGDHVADIKLGYDKEYLFTAKTNAQKIIGSAAAGVEKSTGYRAREDGEHLEVYNQAAFDHYSKTTTESLNKAKSDYEEKLKNFKGSEDVQTSLNELKAKYDALQAKEAAFDEVEASGVQEKYNTLLSENETTKIDSAFTGVLPTFPKEVNEYEKVGKWNEFKKSVLNDHDIVKVDKEYFAVDKTNRHKQTKLSELVANDSNIQALLEGRQQEGLGLKPENLSKIEGVPFEVPKGADSKVRGSLIRDYLTKEGIPVADKRYSVKFKELNDKMLSAA